MQIPAQLSRRAVLGLSIVAAVLLNEPERLDDTVAHVAAQAELEPELLLRAARRAQEQLAEATAHGR